ncbi:MAG: 16S rRNA (guanine(527)-N(7))-methyltransferase RsmG [Thermodesulfobacteriota bacterium]
MDSELSQALHIIISGSRVLGVDISRDAVDNIRTHLNMLVKWRERAGLTSMKGMREIALFHFLDSLTVFKVVPRGTSLTLLDVGSGGGFPGVVLAEADPAISLTVLDRNPRKIVFLKHLVASLNLKSVRFLNQSLGSVLQSPRPPVYDYVVSRAFSSDAGTLQSLALLLGSGGGMICMGGPSAKNAALTLNTLEQADRWEGRIPFSDRERIVTVYRKRAS